MDLSGAASYTAQNIFNLIGESYLIMVIPELARGESTINSTLEDSFARIPLTSLKTVGEFAFFRSDQAKQVKYFSPPLAKLSSLTIEFRTQNGHLYDFNGFDNSFALEIVQVEQENRII